MKCNRCQTLIRDPGPCPACGARALPKLVVDDSAVAEAVGGALGLHLQLLRLMRIVYDEPEPCIALYHRLSEVVLGRRINIALATAEELRELIRALKERAQASSSTG